MSGQFDSELLNPDLQQEIATWDTLEQAYGGWNAPAEPVFTSEASAVADTPSNYIETWNQPETGFPTPAPAATDVTSSAVAAPLEQVYTPSPTLEQLYGGAPEQQMYQPAQFLYGGAPAIEQPLDTTPYFQPEQLDSWESPQNFTQNEWFSTVSGEDIGGGLPVWAEGNGQRFDPNIQLDPSQVVDTRGFFNSRNPQLLESNAQFDATTNPANRDGTGILGGAWNALSSIPGGFIDPVLGPAQDLFAQPFENAGNLLGGYGMRAPGPSGYSGKPSDGTIAGSLAEGAARSFFPGDTTELALWALADPVGEAALGGLRAAPSAIRALRPGTEVLDELPLKAAYAALDNPLQNPAYAPEVANLAVGNLPRSLTGGAADDAARFLDEVIRTNPGQIGDSIAAMRAQGFPDQSIVDFIGQQANDLGAAARRIGQETVEQAPITDLKSALRQDLNIPAPKQTFTTGTVSAGGDPLDIAEANYLKGKWPDLEDAVAAERQAAINEAGTVTQNERWLQEAGQQRAYASPPRVTAAQKAADDAARAYEQNIEKGYAASLKAQQAAREAQIVQAIEEVAPQVAEAAAAGAPPPSFWDQLISLAGLPRALKATLDLSAPGRQGLALAFRHPKEWIEAWKPMLQAWKSDAATTAIQQDLTASQQKWIDLLGEQVGPHLHQIGENAQAMERVPGFETMGNTLVSRGLRKFWFPDASERAYATFLNVQKQKTFDTMAQSLWEANNKEVTPKLINELKGLGRVIDHATGYGAAPLKGNPASGIFFSQRYMTSRFQFLADMVTEAVVNKNPVAARAAAENLIAFAGGMGGLLALVDASGLAEVEWDPRSSNFGKFRLGAQRIDFGAGFLPLIRTAAQIATGERKTQTGDFVSLRGINDDGTRESVWTASGKTALGFFRNKLEPVTAELVNRGIVGEDTIGNKPAPLLSYAMLQDMFMPLIAESTLEAWNETGDWKKVVSSGAAELVGGGTTTYGSEQVRQQDMAHQYYGSDYGKLTSEEQARINRSLVEAGQLQDWKARETPWWTARDDAIDYWASNLSDEERQDERAQAILAFRGVGAESTLDLTNMLSLWMQENYDITRDDADKQAAKYIGAQQLDKLVKGYRTDLIGLDPTFVQDWLDAYNAPRSEVKFSPPKWAREAAGIE